MRAPLEQELHQWIDAGIIDPQTADRIRTFETLPKPPGLRWPAILAIAFGAIMVGAGVLLFVAAHWEDLSPTQRFLLVLAMVAGFHLAAGALMPHMRALGMALHAVGTVALGAGIFLAGQIFNLQEHWPGGILLWALGATLAWWVLRDWPQATLAALLIPAWIASEWSVKGEGVTGAERFLLQFLTLLAITYLSAQSGEDDSIFRRALKWTGGLLLLPLAAILAAEEDWGWGQPCDVCFPACRRLCYGIWPSPCGRLVPAPEDRGLERRLWSLGFCIGIVQHAGHFRFTRCFGRTGHLRGMRTGRHRPGLLGHAGAPPRTHQPGCGGLCHHHRRILFLLRHGQAGALRLAGWIRTPVLFGRLEA